MSRFARTTCPHDCPSVCALDVEVLDDERIGRVRGAKDHDYTRGVICAKVSRYAERQHHPDRLTSAWMRRSGKAHRKGVPGAGLQAFERVPLADAIDRTAGKIVRAVVSTHDALGARDPPRQSEPALGLCHGDDLAGDHPAQPFAQVRDGALLLELNGHVVEEVTPVDPVNALLSGATPVGEYDVQDLVHAIDTAVADDRISAVVLDLSGFLGGGQAHLQDIGAALDRMRAAEKPVLAYAVGYADDGMMLAAHASEVWLDPLGGAVIAGPGGERLYYAGLLDQLNINARVYRAGSDMPVSR